MNINPLHSTGIRNQIQSNSYNYNKLTEEVLDKCIKDIYQKIEEKPHYKILTNWIGYVLFDLSMLGLTISLPNFYPEIIKKGNYLYIIHIGKRSDLIKAYVNKKHQFEIKKGTKLLFTTEKLDKFVFNKIKEYE
jgi:hypothetical protein